MFLPRVCQQGREESLRLSNKDSKNVFFLNTDDAYLLKTVKMFFFLNTDDAYLLSSWSGSFSPVSRRQKRPCYGYVYMVIVTHKHDYVYVKGIFGQLTTDNYINTLCSSFFP